MSSSVSTRGSAWSCFSFASACACGEGLVLLAGGQEALPRPRRSKNPPKAPEGAAEKVESRKRSLADVVAARLCQNYDGSERILPFVRWTDGDSQAFRVRCGPDYRRFGQKDFADPSGSLYTCFAVDVVRDPSSQLRCVTSELGVSDSCRSLPECTCVASPPVCSRSASVGGHIEQRDLALPQTIIINFQVPYEAGPIHGCHPTSDTGCSVLLYYRLRPHAAALARDLSTAPAAVKLLARYLQEDGHPKREGKYVSSCLKAVGVVNGVDSLQIPAALRTIVQRFNGKPVLVEKESRRYSMAGGSVVELAIDIRGFNPLARSLLRRLRGQLRTMTIQVGLLIQGCEDDELPEQLLGAVQLEGLNLDGARLLDASSLSAIAGTGLAQRPETANHCLSERNADMARFFSPQASHVLRPVAKRAPFLTPQLVFLLLVSFLLWRTFL